MTALLSKTHLHLEVSDKSFRFLIPKFKLKFPFFLSDFHDCTKQNWYGWQAITWGGITYLNLLVLLNFPSGCSQVLCTILMSVSYPLRRVSYGLPPFLLPWRFQVIACLTMHLSNFRKVCSICLFCLFLISSTRSRCFWQSTLLLMVPVN